MIEDSIGARVGGKRGRIPDESMVKPRRRAGLDALL